MHGIEIPGRRFTGWAGLNFAGYVAVPILALALVLDLVGWLITVKLFGASCYGVFCFIF